MVYGNTKGIKSFILEELEQLLDIKIEKEFIVNEEVIDILLNFTNKINREINIIVNRNGIISEIFIGDSSSVELPIMDIYEKKLSGKRMIHTHPNGNPNLSNVDISTLMKLKLDCIVSIGIIDERITGYCVGFCSILDSNLSYETINFNNTRAFLEYDFLERVRDIEKDLRKNVVTEDEKEYAILVGIEDEESLDELEELALACDVTIVGRFFQKRSKPDNLAFIGVGKAQELAIFKQIKNANLIITDDELSGLQIRNLEDITGCKVIDRTTLILEIFSKRAKSRESKIQIELTQLKYRSNRLIGFGSIMSRLGGGIGTRGPGEKKLEIDRRRINDNINFLKKELENIRKSKLVQREQRETSNIPKISLVGYTNVGKSTLRNYLVDNYSNDSSVKKDGVFVKDMLFATLDTTTRTIFLPDKRVASVTDTVGFIRKLPHDLVESFKSTLEEVIFSDLIVHVVDASSPEAIDQIRSVESVLEELGCLDKPTILALNKCDLKESKENIDLIKIHFNSYDNVQISAFKGENIDKLLELIVDKLPQTTKECTYLIPYSHTSDVAYLHRNSIVKYEEYLDDGLKIVAIVSDKTYNKMKKFLI